MDVTDISPHQVDLRLTTTAKFCGGGKASETECTTSGVYLRSQCAYAGQLLAHVWRVARIRAGHVSGAQPVCSHQRSTLRPPYMKIGDHLEQHEKHSLEGSATEQRPALPCMTADNARSQHSDILYLPRNSTALRCARYCCSL